MADEPINLQGISGASMKSHSTTTGRPLCLQEMKQDSLLERMCLTFSADMKHNRAERVLHSSANNQNIILLEVVLWNLEVVGSWALADTAGYVVVAAMAGTEPAAIVASVGQGHAAQVSAHAHHHQPLQQDGSLGQCRQASALQFGRYTGTSRASPDIRCR